MKYSKATNHALHTMVYLTMIQTGKTIGVQSLGEIQEVSPAYLSKILTKLVKAGLIESMPGVNGGYKLTKNAKEISFLDVITAIEGNASLFNCAIEHEELINSKNCLIEDVMDEAEQQMKNHLEKQLIKDVANRFDEERLKFIESMSS